MNDDPTVKKIVFNQENDEVVPEEAEAEQAVVEAAENGEIVDAVIFIKDKIIPIDSKFSLENYNKILEERDHDKKEALEKLFKQDLKNRIDETAKYIRPEERTMDFALLRCAEVALENGFNYFLISSADRDTSTMYVFNTYKPGGSAVPIDKPSNAYVIVCFNDKPDDPMAMDAAFLAESIRKKYSLTKKEVDP
jgi:hypothetical protein